MEVNLVYMIFTMTAYFIFLLSFRKDYGVKFSYYAIIILIIRQTARLLDFENTKPYMSRIDWDFLFSY